MKKIREYHIESYWAEEVAKQERKEELKQKVKDSFWIVVGCGVIMGLWFEILAYLFGVM